MSKPFNQSVRQFRFFRYILKLNYYYLTRLVPILKHSAKGSHYRKAFRTRRSTSQIAAKCTIQMSDCAGHLACVLYWYWTMNSCYGNSIFLLSKAQRVLYRSAREQFNRPCIFLLHPSSYSYFKVCKSFTFTNNCELFSSDQLWEMRKRVG